MAEKKDDWKFLELVALAVVLDVIFKQFPFLASVQPILPIALLAGILYGGLRGSAVGVLSAFFSSILFFSQSFSGNLFLLQAAAAVIAGSLGGLAGKSRKPSVAEYVSLCVVAAIAFEALNNFLSGASFGRLSGYYYLEGTALASALHIIASVVLAVFLSSLLDEK